MISLFEKSQLLVDALLPRVVTVMEVPNCDKSTGKVKLVLMNSKTSKVETEYFSTAELFQRFSRLGSSAPSFF